jgi:RNA polymerase sigma factor (sigma-70 family)
VRLERTQKRGGVDQQWRFLQDDSPTARQIADPGLSPLLQAMRNEDANQFETALSQLSEATQEVIRRRCYERLSWSAIAQGMKRSDMAVQRMYWRGQARLKRLIGTEC